MVRRLALAMAFALALVGGTTARADAYASRRRVKVVWFDTERVYAAWSAEDGARVGAEATLFRADGTPFGRCRAVWVNDAITAFALPEARWSQVGVYPNTWLELDPEPGPTGHPSGTLTVPIANLPATLDPAHLTALAEKQVGVQIFEGLVRYGPESTPILAAADSATVSGSTWIFHLPASGRFHDGRPLRAADVVASLTRAVSPATHAPRVDALLEAIGGGYLFHDGKTSALQGVTVVDSLRVQIVARDQAMLFDALASPAAWIVPTPAADQPGFAQAPVGSGPFRLAARDSTGLLLVAAAGRTAGPDTLRFRLTHGLEDTELQFELGRLDLAAVRSSEASRLANSKPPGMPTVRARPVDISLDWSLYYLGMNTRARWLADRAHRRAISAAIDRNLAVRVLADGAGTLAHGLQPGDEHALPDSAWSPNPSEAGALPALKPPPAGLAFWVPQGSDLGVRVAEFVQVALARHGVRVHIERAPWDEFMRAVDDGRADLFYLSWFADSYDRVAFVSSLIESSHRGAGGNRTWYSNPQVDAQLLRARSISDPEVKATALADAERIALSDAPLVPLFQGTSIFVERPWVNGFRSNGLGCPRYDTVEVTRGR